MDWLLSLLPDWLDGRTIVAGLIIWSVSKVAGMAFKEPEVIGDRWRKINTSRKNFHQGLKNPQHAVLRGYGGYGIGEESKSGIFYIFGCQQWRCFPGRQRHPYPSLIMSEYRPRVLSLAWWRIRKPGQPQYKSHTRVCPYAYPYLSCFWWKAWCQYFTQHRGHPSGYPPVWEDAFNVIGGADAVRSIMSVGGDEISRRKKTSALRAIVNLHKKVDIEGEMIIQDDQLRNAGSLDESKPPTSVEIVMPENFMSNKVMSLRAHKLIKKLKVLGLKVSQEEYPNEYRDDRVIVYFNNELQQ